MLKGGVHTPTPPKWLESLKKDPQAGEGIHWFTPEESEAKRAELVRWYESGDARVRHHLPDAAFTAARSQVARFLPLGEGPTASDRAGNKTRCWLLMDKQSRDELRVALSPVHPPFLWLTAGQTATSLKEALAPYFPSFVPAEEKLERTLRGFLGTGATHKIDLMQLHTRYAHSAFLDGTAWGSAHKKDPLQSDMLLKGPEGEEQARRYREQAPEGPPSFSFRTLFSKSILRAEAFANVADGVNVFIGELRYQPAKQAELIRKLNSLLGTKYPEELPVDLAGALLGLPFDTADVIRPALQQQTDPAKISFGLICLDCLAPDDATAEKDLRPSAAHEDGSVRQLVANLALRRRLKGLLAEMTEKEQHPEFKQQLVEASQLLAQREGAPPS
jgi:hypothetical protein